MLLSVPIKPNDPGFEELIKALENCPSIEDPQKRKDIVGFLDDEIRNQVEERGSVRASVISILKAFSGFPDQFDKLINAIDFYEQGNIYLKKIIEVVRDIARQQQESKNRPTETITIFGDVEFKNDRDETFETLWSELCSILGTIDWKDIWEACSKIKEIKSLCFTKNYELLKQVFLDHYNYTLLIRQLSESLKGKNKDIKLWLDKANQKLKETGATPDPNIDENKSCYPPILLIIIDRLGDGQNQDKWNVRGQFKFQDQLFEILFYKNKNGIDCPNFENIPTAIKAYIDYLENEPQFRDQEIDQLRIELFIPIFEFHSSLDKWAIICEEEAPISLVKQYRLFLRTRERARNNRRIGLLKKGWNKLDIFLKNTCLEISKATIDKNINNTQESHIIEIINNNQVSNWRELEIFMEKSSILWCVRLKCALFSNKDERNKFFESILNSGIPIAFWSWEKNPSKVNIEQKFTECLSRDNLSNRCYGLLEKTWELRSILWGARTEAERKKYPGYYLGMLLEDPEILPEDNPLQTIGVNR
jgi:hypothetical protein